ncbi:hypothetical protein HMPREF9336_01673 [Segniliparus rugosus ATCC BAA-974]|uniref:Uncharacterized protein n=2 Tax=Segniliparus rugosus TaxID=286804 RepID=E5XQA1_SEGRC|nr:hypothetical protein HMPREF9336_01673 [Segniliparus rugosus ATCC BAA-974]
MTGDEARRAAQVFELMHYACFHFEFEHSLGADAAVGAEDVWCQSPGCPAQPGDWRERLGLLWWSGRGRWGQGYLDDRQEGQLERLSAARWIPRSELADQLMGGTPEQVGAFFVALREAAGALPDGAVETEDERAERLARSDACFDQLRRLLQLAEEQS